MHSYYLEFILNTYHSSLDTIKSSLAEFTDTIEIFPLPQDDAGKGENFKVHIRTEEPTLIFDACAQLGRIKSVKINEEGGS